MKRILSLAVSAFVVIFFAATSLAQLNTWRQQSPSQAGITFQAVQMIDANIIYACGDDASFGRSTDGGFSWEIQRPVAGIHLSAPFSTNFYALNFINKNYGMVCGDSGKVLKTTDGGMTWQIFSIGDKKSKLLSIVVIDTNIAIVVGKNAFLKHTLNGGKTWQIYPVEKVISFTSIRKLRPNFISLAGYDGTLMVSRDSGANWSTIPITVNGNRAPENIYGHLFADEQNATVIGENAYINHTTDAGLTWARQNIGDSTFLSAPLNFIDGKDPKVMAMVGDYGTILYTSTNGGVHWNKYELRLGDSILGLSYLDKLTAVAVGQDGIVMKTTDGGVHWDFIPERPLVDALNGIAFPKGDTSLGIAVGFATIMRTTDGGARWTRAKFDATESLKSVAFADPNIIYAVGDQGIFVKSVNAGLTWSILPKVTEVNLLCICFATPNFGWITGNAGTLLSSIDGGLTWTKHTFSKKRNLTGISFSDSLHGYLCSDKGVYVTTDGGTNWEEPDDATYFTPCVGIHSPSPNFVCAIGTGCGGSPGGAILTSSDGGKTWKDTIFTFYSTAELAIINQGPFPSGILNGVYFSDSLHGTIVGSFADPQEGNIFHTTDGGKTWLRQLPNAQSGFHAVCFPTNKAGTAVGHRGTIIRRTTNE
jgi:photosystem II stability/assembly factor-like uncharacterized protein